MNYIHNVLEAQVRELITQYNPDILWFDGEWVPWWNEEYGREVEEMARSLKPGIIINNRVGKRTSADGDYDTPEQAIPPTTANDRLWETAMTLNDTWGYKDTDTDWKSPATVLSNLMDTVSKGGNLLLNVGPDGTGVIPAASVSILQQVGQWIGANARAVYNTLPAPVTTEPWGKLTRAGSSLYATIFNWPAAGSIHLDIAATVTNVHLLINGTSVPFTSTAAGIDLSLAGLAPQGLATVVKIDFRGELAPLV